VSHGLSQVNELSTVFADLHSTIRIVKVYRADTLQDAALVDIVSLLRAGQVIAFPTDTAYGLAVDPMNDLAIERIFRIKGRAETKPILLIVNSVAMARTVSEPPPVFYEVADEFWPGPLTLIVPSAAVLSDKLTARTGTIGLRWPAAPLATTLAGHFGKPITATSANRSGLPSAISAEEVQSQLGESVDALIDGGTLTDRGGSSLLDLTKDPPVLLREGPVSFDRLNGFFKGRLRRHVA
jgi:L-threonylcarbamoyladenylate synthase